MRLDDDLGAGLRVGGVVWRRVRGGGVGMRLVDAGCLRRLGFPDEGRNGCCSGEEPCALIIAPGAIKLVGPG